ncbi:MAG: sulfotransferase [Actinomycetota bacterium]
MARPQGGCIVDAIQPTENAAGRSLFTVRTPLNVGCRAPKKVLFIGGYGRSGSTLLDRVLGHCGHGFFSGGELRHIFVEGYLENRRCGCGVEFRSCDFWSAVTELAFGTVQESDVRRVLELKARVDRWFYIPRLGIPLLRSARAQRELAEYRSILSRLYSAIFEVAGCEVLVDSTKDPSHGWVLSTMPDIELHVVHLVRDSRAVAFSWQRKKYNPGSGQHMNRYSLLKTGAEWNAINAFVGLLRRRAASHTLLRYEDFVAEPARALRPVLDRLGAAGSIDPDGVVELRDDHTVAGNPVRFQRGEIRLRLDDEWRRDMAPAGKLMMTTLTAPRLARYNFHF